MLFSIGLKVSELGQCFCKFGNVVGRLLGDRSANVALIFSLAFPALLVSTGGAIDFSRAVGAQMQLQQLADGAALAGVSYDGDNPERMEVAENFFESTRAARDLIASADFEWSGHGQTAVMNVSASSALDTLFLGIFGIHDIEFSVSAAATASPTWGDGCWMSMDEHQKHTIELHDDVKIEAPNCHFYGNSDHHNDVVDLHSCTNVLNARQVQSVGGGHHAGIEPDHCDVPLTYNIPSGVFLNAYVIDDPIGHAVVESALEDQPDGCLEPEHNGGVLSPGTYCDGLEITGNVTLSAGTYFILDDMEIEDAHVTGNDVTIVFDRNAEFLWEDSYIRLSAPTDGDLAGMAILGLNDSKNNEIYEALVDIQGVIYMPLAKLDWTHSRHNSYSGMSQVHHDWTVWIVEGAKWRGDGTIFLNFPEGQIDPDDDAYEGYPESLRRILPESNSLSARLVD